MNADDVKTLKDELSEYVQEVLDGWSELHYRTNGTVFHSPGGFTWERFELIDTFGGEGQGVTAWLVIRVTMTSGEEIYLEKTGFYSSWDGMNLDDGALFVVTPREKVVTVFEIVESVLES